MARTVAQAYEGVWGQSLKLKHFWFFGRTMKAENLPIFVQFGNTENQLFVLYMQKEEN